MQYGISIDLVLFTYNCLSLNEDMMGSQCILCYISKQNRRHQVRAILQVNTTCSLFIIRHQMKTAIWVQHET